MVGKYFDKIMNQVCAFQLFRINMNKNYPTLNSLTN